MPTVPTPVTFEGHLTASGKRFALVCARFNHFIVDQLELGAIDTLLRHGASLDDIAVFRVPGAWELPLAVQRIARTGKFDAVIALGAVIRGSTPHFDYVAAECVKGMAAVQMDSSVPVSFGVLCNEIKGLCLSIELHKRSSPEDVFGTGADGAGMDTGT